MWTFIYTRNYVHSIHTRANTCECLCVSAHIQRKRYVRERWVKFKFNCRSGWACGFYPRCAWHITFVLAGWSYIYCRTAPSTPHTVPVHCGGASATNATAAATTENNISGAAVLAPVMRKFPCERSRVYVYAPIRAQSQYEERENTPTRHETRDESDATDRDARTRAPGICTSNLCARLSVNAFRCSCINCMLLCMQHHAGPLVVVVIVRGPADTILISNFSLLLLDY